MTITTSVAGGPSTTTVCSIALGANTHTQVRAAARDSRECVDRVSAGCLHGDLRKRHGHSEPRGGRAERRPRELRLRWPEVRARVRAPLCPSERGPRSLSSISPSSGLTLGGYTLTVRGALSPPRHRAGWPCSLVHRRELRLKQLPGQRDGGRACLYAADLGPLHGHLPGAGRDRHGQGGRRYHQSGPGGQQPLGHVQLQRSGHHISPARVGQHQRCACVSAAKLASDDSSAPGADILNITGRNFGPSVGSVTIGVSACLPPFTWSDSKWGRERGFAIARPRVSRHLQHCLHHPRWRGRRAYRAGHRGRTDQQRALHRLQEASADQHGAPHGADTGTPRVRATSHRTYHSQGGDLLVLQGSNFGINPIVTVGGVSCPRNFTNSSTVCGARFNVGIAVS